ncbi:helix-turn-helix domain-containing protein [Oerskovia sp. USHLN155]|uniref:helix-turn-helix domain-containing protein n=1 Tax=Oerskovia sp. USHLN155 TaxID=3081288 RepID=UPI003FA5C4C9
MNPLSQLSIGKRVRGALPETVRKLIASGDLKAYRLGGDRGPWRIRPEALRAYREQQARRAADPRVRTRPTRGRTWSLTTPLATPDPVLVAIQEMRGVRTGGEVLQHVPTAQVRRGERWRGRRSAAQCHCHVSMT